MSDFEFRLVPLPQSDFAKIFGARPEYTLRKVRYRGAVPGRHLHRIKNLTREEAVRYLAHDPSGRVLVQQTNSDIDTLADLLVEASNKMDNPEEENSVDKNFDAVSFAKRVVNDGVSAVSEQQGFELIQRYADANRLPNEKSSAAFAKIYGADDDVGLNFRKMIQLAKGFGHPHV